MNIKVAARVRPFNQRELFVESKLCVEMNGATTHLIDPEDKQKIREFTFDHSFWSHDQFSNNQGYLKPETDKYADQSQIFQKFGLQMISSAWEGYNCSILAYGQSGAGKTYTMIGNEKNRGIVLLACEQIFRRIKSNQEPNKSYEVYVSMFQIYNERIQDLMVPLKQRRQGLRVRENKIDGIYIYNLSKHLADSYENIQKIIQEGYRNQSIATTFMSIMSSRAHTIIYVEIKQNYIVQGVKRHKCSVMKFVDLAGSQKLAKTGAPGDRLRQSACIGKSLSVLGLIISRLAEKALDKEKKTIIPYRDSCLTRILQNALGGNSLTSIIFAISPASGNHDQTLSTLRYADQAKKIRNDPVVNQVSHEELFKDMELEKAEIIESVKKMQENFEKGKQIPRIFQADQKQQHQELKSNYCQDQNQKKPHQQEKNQ